MLNTGTKNKQLLIVYDRNSKPYAIHLMQLIGLKEEKVKAVMLDEQEYSDSEGTITSNEKLLFIGRSKITKLNNENTVKKYSRYGIEYGWLGNRAVVTVSKKKTSNTDYEQFLGEAQMTADQFEEKMSSYDLLGSKLPGGIIAGIFGIGIFFPIVPYALGVPVLIEAVIRAKIGLENQKKIRKQKNSFAVLKFYFEHLSEFVEV